MLVKLGALGDSIDTLWYLRSLSENFNTTILVLDKYAIIYKLVNYNIRLIEIKSYRSNIMTIVSAIFTIIKNYVITTKFISLMQYSTKYYIFFKIMYPFAKVGSLKKIENFAKDNQNRVDSEINLINFLSGSQIVKSRPDLPLNSSNTFLINTPYIAYAIGGGNSFDDAKNRLGPIDQVGDALKEISDYTVVLLGFGKSDEARAIKFISKYGNYYKNNIINMVGKAKLDITIQLIKNSTLFIGYDSSLLKVANILNKKGVVLLGPTTANQLLDDSTTITPIITDQLIKCMPCYKSSDGLNSPLFHCKENICIQSIRSSTIKFYLNKSLGNTK